MKAETRVRRPGAKEGQQRQKPGQGPGTDSPSETPEGINPAYTLILDFWPPELGGSKFLLLKPPGLWYFVTAATELIQSPIPTPGNYLKNFSKIESQNYRCAVECNNYTPGNLDTGNHATRLIFQVAMSDIYYFMLEKA